MDEILKNVQPQSDDDPDNNEAKSSLNWEEWDGVVNRSWALP
jgi:hypothetical protein